MGGGGSAATAAGGGERGGRGGVGAPTLLGEGSGGMVYRGVYKALGQDVAIKVLCVFFIGVFEKCWDKMLLLRSSL